MRIIDAISMADAVKPNAFDEATKIRWLSEVEGMIQADIWLLAPEEWIEYDETTPTDTQLLVTGGHSKIYRAYLCAMIDLANGEYDHYANTSAVVNDYLQEYELWYARVYHPADTWREVWKGHYFTAYGLAVKHGYAGTEAEWLASLRGPQGEPFRYEDFTQEQLAALIGPQGPKGEKGDRGYDGSSVGIDGRHTLPFANAIMLDAYLTRAVNDTAPGCQRFVELSVPGDGCELSKGEWLLRVWRKTEELAIVEAVSENGQRLTRTLRGHAESILNEETVDNWKVEADYPGLVSDEPSVAILANGAMTIGGPTNIKIYSFASVQVPGSKEWSDYDVQARMTYRSDSLYHAGLVYNAQDREHYQKAGVYQNVNSPSYGGLNARDGGLNGGAHWKFNKNTSLFSWGNVAKDVPIDVYLHTEEMKALTPGISMLDVVVGGGTNDNPGNEFSVKGFTVKNVIYDNHYKGTVGFVLRGGVTLEVNNILVTDANGNVLYREDFSAYDGVWGEWMETLAVKKADVKKASFHIYCGAHGGAYINHGLNVSTLLRSECLLEDGGTGTPVEKTDYEFSVDKSAVTVYHNYDPAEGLNPPYAYANVTIWYL